MYTLLYFGKKNPSEPIQIDNKEWQYTSASTLTLSGPLLSNTMFTMVHWLVLKLLYISSLTTFKIPLCFVHSVTLLRRFMRAILKSNKLTEGGQSGQLFNLFYQIWLDLSFVVWQRLHGYKQGKTVASLNSLWLQRGKVQMHSLVALKMNWSNGWLNWIPHYKRLLSAGNSIRCCIRTLINTKSRSVIWCQGNKKVSIYHLSLKKDSLKTILLLFQ